MRILAVADIYEALTAHRPYRDGMPLERAMGIVRSDAPHKLDATAVASLEAWVATDDPAVLPPAKDTTPAPLAPPAPVEERRAA